MEATFSVSIRLSERAAELQQTVDELQKVLDVTRRARDEDQHALQQEVEERDQLIQSFSGENQRLHRLLQVRKILSQNIDDPTGEARWSLDLF